MSDTTQLIGILGEVDRAVAVDPERRANVARVIPIYDSPRAVWYDQFLAWSHDRGIFEGEFPSLPIALEALGDEARDEPPKPRTTARSALAIAAAAQAFPDELGPGGPLDGRAVQALNVQGLIEDQDSAHELLAYLREAPARDEQIDALDRWWDGVRERVRAREIGPRPCTSRLITIPEADGPVAALTAGFETDRVDFADACSFLEPSHWPGCSDFWCSMEKLADLPHGGVRYLETVSTDCGNPDVAWTISAVLDFGFKKIGDTIAITSYGLPDDRPKPGDDVEVDEGSLLVEDIGGPAAPRIRVGTTKRIRFSGPFSGEALALIMCALGYADAAYDLVFNCAINRNSGDPFPDPGVPPVKLPGKGTIVDDVIDKGAAAVKDCVDDYAEVAKASYEKIAAGTYDLDAAVQDSATLAVRLLRDGATAVQVGMRATKGGKAPEA
jgi:hypothetical protein